MTITAFDTETELIAPGNQAPHMICLSVASVGGKPRLIHWKESKAPIEELLKRASFDNPLVGHNVAFDLAVIAEIFPDFMPLIFECYKRSAIRDTQIREKMINIAFGRSPGGKSPYSLATLTGNYLGKTLDKDTWRLKYAELKHTALESWPEGAKDYALTDAQSTLDVYLMQRCQERDLPDLFYNEPAQVAADFALKLASNRGIVTDPQSVAEFVEKTKDRFEDTRSALIDSGLLKEVIKKGELTYSRNIKKARELLEQVAPDKIKRTHKGQIKLDEDACLASGNETLENYIKYAKLQTLITKDCGILQSGTKHPIHTYFNILVNSGRTSSRSPNMQNPRREPGIRECFVPRPGFVFASADYNSAELHTLAQVCTHFFKFSKLGDLLNSGIDPHLELGARLIRVPYAEAVKLKKSGDKKVLEARQIAKAANFGFPGGMGPDAFLEFSKGYGLNLTREFVQNLKRTWLESFPEMVQYFKFIDTQVKTGRLKHLCSKRHRGGITFTSACNSYFQGLASDGAKAALFEVQRQCQVEINSPLYDSHIVNFVHDEIILESPECRASEAANHLAKIMVEQFNFFVPDVPVSASPQLMRCWSKNAHPIVNSRGVLIPWEKKNVPSI